jgi:hypothetical protein
MNTAVPERDGRRARDDRHEVIDWNRARREPLGDDPPSRLPCRHHGEDEAATMKGQPSALRHLQQVGAEEREVDRQKDGVIA